MNTLQIVHVCALPMTLEGLMLVCFGIAWPLANLRMLRSGRPEGKGGQLDTAVAPGPSHRGCAAAGQRRGMNPATVSEC